MKDKKEYSNESQLNLKSLVVLTRTSQTVRRQEAKTILETGLTLGQFGVLEALYHKGPLRISVVTEKILSTGGNMTVVINNLVKSGLIKKYKDKEDNRANIVELTRSGVELMDLHFPRHIENINNIYSVLDNSEKEHLINLLKKLSRV